jgi:hypothetical protein
VSTTQADAVLAILERRSSGGAVSEREWQDVFGSEGYLRLQAREQSMKRPFEPDAFRKFVLSIPEDRALQLRRTLDQWKAADIERIAARVTPYLPAGTSLSATVYPVIKPQTNSFVFLTADYSAIFLYVDPKQSTSAFENIVAHELHHVGLNNLMSAYHRRIEALPDHARQAARWMGAFGEGLAVLAAAGSPDRDPMADFPEADRTRWKQDYEAVDQHIRQLDAFFLDIVNAGFAKPEVADRVAFTFFGYRGPWYTVGYRMAQTVEKRFGRAALLECMSDPRLLLARYNEAAASDQNAAKWSPKLLEAVCGGTSQVPPR